MTLQILVRGHVLDPKEAVQQMLPLDTMLICPACESAMVQALEPKTGIQLPAEIKQYIPRQQDRMCLACGHKWMTVLPPAIVSLPYLR